MKAILYLFYKLTKVFSNIYHAGVIHVSVFKYQMKMTSALTLLQEKMRLVQSHGCEQDVWNFIK